MRRHPDCEDSCLVAEARGPLCACEKICAYSDQQNDRHLTAATQGANMETKHTPTPWVIEHGKAWHSIRSGAQVICSDENANANWDANATRIVECVNGYDGLAARVADLQGALDKLVRALNDRPDLIWPLLKQPLADANAAVDRVLPQQSSAAKRQF
jgi:hypothetical protein